LPGRNLCCNASAGSGRAAEKGFTSFNGVLKSSDKKIGAFTSERGTGLFLLTVDRLTVLPPTWVDPAGSPANLGGELASTNLCLFTAADC